MEIHSIIINFITVEESWQLVETVESLMRNEESSFSTRHFQALFIPQIERKSLKWQPCLSFSSIGKYREHRNVVHNIQIGKRKYNFTTNQGKNLKPVSH